MGDSPRRNLITIVPVTAEIEEDHTCSLVNCNEVCTSDSSGEIENLQKIMLPLEMLCADFQQNRIERGTATYHMRNAT